MVYEAISQSKSPRAIWRERAEGQANRAAARAPAR
ncbi:hypothetical protein M218_30415 [Burkholderia pseudomallei MSHR338]|nr:hypothetical protein BURPS406E_P0052 [Burkholderia pseudomallei 406e]EDO92722.1 hypothetical protein BURPSPAST_E0042 [Burkholderia pseudomallei Pasteur 52237]EDS84729.1 hypothetical protein BURPSS13_J0348 [Burkholderia pseudomallei S13]EQA85232.1 hypothetical protein M218_30415 [Burkholderia pseudomallei MSHR338]